MEERTLKPADLAGSELFESFRGGNLEALLKLGTLRVYQPGNLIYSTGTINTKLLIIRKGTVEISYSLGGHEIPIEVLESGNIWGYTTLLNPGKKYPYNMRSRNHVTEVIELPIDKLLRLIHEDNAGPTGSLIYELARLQTKRSRERQAKVALFAGLASLLHTAPGTHILDRILELVTASFDCKRALIASFDANSHTVTINAVYNLPPNLIGDRKAIASDTVLSICYNTDRVFVVTPKTFEKKFELMPYAAETMVALPLRSDSVTIGVLLCTEKKGREFSEEDILMLEAISSLVGSALQGMNRSEEYKHSKLLKQNYVSSLPRF